MTAEFLTAIASVGSFVVITASVIAGFIQLRHLRASNEIQMLNEFRVAFESPEVQALPDALLEIRERLNDPACRAALDGPFPVWVRPALPALRLFEILGVYVRDGIVSKRIMCDMWSPVILSDWEALEPLIVVMRRTRGENLFENFELIAYYSKRWLLNESSTYPKNIPRIGAKDPWAAVDVKGEA